MGLKMSFFYNNAQESSNFVFKSKIKEKKVVEGTGYRPDLKCTRGEAIVLYKNLVLQSRRDMQRAILGKGPYTLSLSHQHLEVTPIQWSVMNRKEREKHLANSAVEESKETP